MAPSVTNQARSFAHRILVVDDDDAVLTLCRELLSSRGYEVKTATDGFEALLTLQKAMPDVIISDLRMPNMSGFELLSVVRRRFPHIPVIAISGEFDMTMPVGTLADAFFMKGHYSVEELFTKIADLLERSPLRPQVGKVDRAPVWFPRNTTNYYVLTCPDCLRSFSVDAQPASGDMQRAECLFCNATVRYLLEAEPARKAGVPVKAEGRRFKT